MAGAAVNGIHVEYETIGNPSDPPLLLIAGLSDQLIHWDDGLCGDLAARGHYVIRFDNRDAGLSTRVDAAYTLDDMADDAVGLLDALDLPTAHLCGASMGGMIAQIVAIRHPARVLSLTIVYSTSGSRRLPPPRPDVLELLFTPSPREKGPCVEFLVGLHRAFSGKGFAFDEAWTRTIVARAYDRSFSPEGTSRQLRAVMDQTDRRSALASVRVPTLVIHGTDDPLVPLEAAVQLSEAIPGARLLLIEGMGHDLPHGGAWPKIVEAVSEHTADAGRKRA
ncbi:MAG: alpha/beta fold hydrolase [Deltaproteobacteria bacterium]|nr:alpha/beta fold hydrolase [Deltaproteobacteria bacterium]